MAATGIVQFGDHARACPRGEHAVPDARFIAGDGAAMAGISARHRARRAGDAQALEFAARNGQRGGQAAEYMSIWLPITSVSAGPPPL